MKDTSAVGTKTEGIILAAFLRRGFTVLLPFGGHAKYDLAIERDGVIHKVQCKTGRLRNGVITFKAYSETRGAGGKRSQSSYTGAIDAFAIYCPENDLVYWAPIADFPKGCNSCFRVDPPRNKQVRGIRWAKDYLLTNEGR